MDETKIKFDNEGEMFRYKFILQTTERSYELYTTSEGERDLWVTCFSSIA